MVSILYDLFKKYSQEREILLSKRISLKICMQSEKKILKWQDDKNRVHTLLCIQCQYINFCPNMQNL